MICTPYELCGTNQDLHEPDSIVDKADSTTQIGQSDNLSTAVTPSVPPEGSRKNGKKGDTVSSVSGGQISANKVADRREISMDCVAKPTRYEPPGFKPTPREPRAGWLSTIVPRRCVHYRAFLLTPVSVPLECSAQLRKAREGPPAPLSPSRASNLRPPGRSPRALPKGYATDVAEKPETKTTTLQWKIPPPARCGCALSVYQEQQLFTGRPAPSL